MRAAHLVEHHRGPSGEPRPARRGEVRAAVPPRDAGAGLEPFLLASVLGLGLWALLLAPFLL
jgi:hypothetical protein